MSPNPSLTTSAAFDLLQDEIDARLAGLQTDIAEAARHGGLKVEGGRFAFGGFKVDGGRVEG